MKNFIVKIKNWLYVPSNRSFVVSEISGVVIALGHIADHSVSPYIALAPAVYGLVHVIFPDFNVTPAQVAQIAADLEKA